MLHTSSSEHGIHVRLGIIAGQARVEVLIWLRWRRYPAIEAVVVAYLAADFARFAARTVACLAADHARLAARCVGMLQPAAVVHAQPLLRG